MGSKIYFALSKSEGEESDFVAKSSTTQIIIIEVTGQGSILCDNTVESTVILWFHFTFF